MKEQVFLKKLGAKEFRNFIAYYGADSNRILLLDFEGMLGYFIKYFDKKHNIFFASDGHSLNAWYNRPMGDNPITKHKNGYVLEEKLLAKGNTVMEGYKEVLILLFDKIDNPF